MNLSHRLDLGLTRLLLGQLLLVCAITGCASRGVVRDTPGPKSQTVMGDYQAVASCLAEAGSKIAGPAPTLRIDRAKKTAQVYRAIDASGGVLYEITLSQVGTATVQVEGRSAPVLQGGARPLEFLWPQVSMCATNLTAP